MREDSAISALSALAHQTRLRVFRLLVEVGENGLAAGEIAEHAQVPPATLSTHLSILVDAGLATRTRESRVIRYRLAGDAVRALFEFLLADCCRGRPELCGFGARAVDCGVEAVRT
jgi:ArsR family transcriptional regulator, arsenate/arsenite/antimonite-responsive transcriptional repressor